VLIAGAVWTTIDYFGHYATQPKVYDAFHGTSVERGRLVAEQAQLSPVYAMPVLWRQSVIRFLSVGRDIRSFDPASGLVLPPAALPDSTAGGSGQTADRAVYLLDPAEAQLTEVIGRLSPILDTQRLTDSRGSLSLVAVELPVDRPTTLPTVGPFNFGESIALSGVAVEPDRVYPAGAVTVTMLYRALRPTVIDQNLFVHMVTGGDRTVGQFDGPPLDGSYPTDTWRPGERILQEVVLRVDPDASPGPVTLRTGWYDWRNQVRLPLAGDDDAAAEIGMVEIVAPTPGTNATADLPAVSYTHLTLPTIYSV